MKQKCYGMIFVGKNFGKIFVSDSLIRNFALFQKHKNPYKFESPFCTISEAQKPIYISI